MIKIKSLTLQNFLSIGNVTQAIKFEESEIYLVLGENLDLGGNDNRNGAGKTSILNGLSYALYGKPIVNIKLENLINKTNGKKMMVTLEFEKDGVSYRIERGRKPVKLRFIVDNKEFEADDQNEAQGENRLTQQEIEKVLGLSHDMFKMIVGLNTTSTPFLGMKAAEQRAIIEQLLGITQLSEKADLLRELVKGTKDKIKEEEFRIKALKEANRRIEENIKSQVMKSKAWEKTKRDKIQQYHDALDTLLEVDIDHEINLHEKMSLAGENNKKIAGLEADLSSKSRSVQRLLRQRKNLQKSADVTNEKTCPTCGHALDEEVHAELHGKFADDLTELDAEIENLHKDIRSIEDELSKLSTIEIEDTFYPDLSSAYEHKSSISQLKASIEDAESSENPYTDNIESLRSDSLQEINYEKMDELSSLRDHQEFLLKLLTSRDSFIRKRIINQNLDFLNKRLEWYLVKIGLPHQVKFMSDLSVEINQHGRDLDFDNLSRGEKTRLILSLSWAFRDVFESMNHRINLMFIDELMDNGLDVNGVESALSLLKKMTRDNRRCVHLISHRDELIGRVDNVLTVVKEGGFTTITSGEN